MLHRFLFYKLLLIIYPIYIKYSKFIMLRRYYLRALSLFIILNMLLISCNIIADTNIVTVLDDPATAKQDFDGNIQVDYNSQKGNNHISNLTTSITMTWFRQTNAYSIWGTATNNSPNNQHRSEKYQAGARTRHNLNTENFLFAQGSWLGEHNKSNHSCYTLALGYGRQILNGPLHNMRVEFGPGVRHDDHQNYKNIIQVLAYGSVSYSYQFTENTKLIQGLSLLSDDNTIINSETGINISVNEHFALKLFYNINWNKNLPLNAQKHTDTKTLVSLLYIIQ